MYSRSTAIKTAHIRPTAIKATQSSSTSKQHTVGQQPSKQCTVGQHPLKQHIEGQYPSKQRTVGRQPSGVPPTVSVPATSPAPSAGPEEAAGVGRPPAWQGGRQPFAVGCSCSGRDCESPRRLKSSLLLQPNSSLLKTHISLMGKCSYRANFYTHNPYVII